jgi:hypothetical protein
MWTVWIDEGKLMQTNRLILRVMTPIATSEERELRDGALIVGGARCCGGIGIVSSSESSPSSSSDELWVLARAGVAMRSPPSVREFL